MIKTRKDSSESGIIGLNWSPKFGAFEINLKMGGDKLETNENILKILLSTVLVKIGLFLHRFELQRCFNPSYPIIRWNMRLNTQCLK